MFADHHVGAPLPVGYRRKVIIRHRFESSCSASGMKDLRTQCKGHCTYVSAPCSFAPIICDFLPAETACRPEDLQASSQTICCRVLFRPRAQTSTPQWRISVEAARQRCGYSVLAHKTHRQSSSKNPSKCLILSMTGLGARPRSPE